MKRGTGIIGNKYGLHARTAVTIVNEASKYASDIYLIKGIHRANAKSTLGLMMLEAAQGTKLEIEISGPDEVEAFEAINKLFTEKFGED